VDSCLLLICDTLFLDSFLARVSGFATLTIVTDIIMIVLSRIQSTYIIALNPVGRKEEDIDGIRMYKY